MRYAHARQPVPRRRAAFTLVELIVIIIMLGIVAGLTAPRIIGSESRRARETVRDIQGQLSAAAFRHAVSGLHARIVYDRDEGEQLVMEVLAPEDAEDEVPTLAWRRDRFSGAVDLEGLVIEEVRVDGFPVDDDEQWEIVFTGGQPRPSVEITVKLAAGERDWLIELEPSETVAAVRDPDDAPPETDEIDLDALGIGDSPW